MKGTSLLSLIWLVACYAPVVLVGFIIVAISLRDKGGRTPELKGTKSFCMGGGRVNIIPCYCFEFFWAISLTSSFISPS